MSFLSDTIAKQISIGETSLKEIEASFSKVSFPRKSLLVRAGDMAHKLAFIESGYLRMFRIDEEGKETTVWIGGRGKFITSISSFVEQKPSIWNIEALIDSDLRVIKRDRLLFSYLKLFSDIVWV